MSFFLFLFFLFLISPIRRRSQQLRPRVRCALHGAGREAQALTHIDANTSARAQKADTLMSSTKDKGGRRACTSPHCAALRGLASAPVQLSEEPLLPVKNLPALSKQTRHSEGRRQLFLAN